MLIAGTWTITPVLMWTDRLNFDGRVVSRAGMPAFLSRLIRRSVTSVKVEDIERVDVATLRTLRRGGSVRYRYRIEIAGRERLFAFASGGRGFRQMVQTLLPLGSDYQVDARPPELRDCLLRPKTAPSGASHLG